MSDDAAKTDLFGQPVPSGHQELETELALQDRATLAERAERVRWLETLLPENTSFAMPPETAFVLEEARASFVHGNYVACVLLAAAFVEHWLQASWQSREVRLGKVPRTLSGMIERARELKAIDEYLLDRIDALRLIRNPFVHLKDYDHPHTIGQRTVSTRRDLLAVLESDARNAMITMHGVAIHAFR